MLTGVLHVVSALNDNLQCLILRLFKGGKELCHLASNPPHVFPKWNIYDCLKILLSWSTLSSFLFITEVTEDQYSFHSFCFHGIRVQVISQTQSTSATLSLKVPFSFSLFFSFCDQEPKLRIQRLFMTNIHRLAHIASWVR